MRIIANPIAPKTTAEPREMPMIHFILAKMSLFGSGKGTVKNLSESLRIAARQNGSAGRTAHRAPGMKVGESEAGRGEGVNIRCVVGLASVASGVSISEVVGNDEHKIRPAGCKAHW